MLVRPGRAFWEDPEAVASMGTALARFGFWVVGLPAVWYYGLFVVLAYVLCCGWQWWLGEREIAPQFFGSARTKRWMFPLLLAMTLCMTLFFASSIVVSIDSRYRAAFQDLPEARREMLRFGFKITPIAWYAILGGIVHRMWKAHHAQR